MGSVAVVLAAVTATIAAAATTIAAVSTVATTLGLFAVVVFLVDPALHANDAVKGAGFGKAVVERNAEGLKWHFASR